MLARIDDALYAADAAAAKAQLAQAKAAVQKAQADLGQMQAKLLQTENDWARAQQAGTIGCPVANRLRRGSFKL